MKYNVTEILNLFDSFMFPEVFTYEDVIYLIKELKLKTKEPFRYEYGASKLVIIPLYKDYVIKIPFGGAYNTYNDEITVFEGAGYYLEQINISRDWDYCETEMLIYNHAKKYNLEKYFAETILIGKVDNDYPIYVQEKCITLNEYYETGQKEYSQEQKEKFSKKLSKSNIDKYTLPIEWCIEFCKEYSIQELKKLIDYLNKEVCVSDFHTGNLGRKIKSYKLVLIDYSDFLD